MNIQDIENKHIIVQPPKKYDTFMISKMRYNNSKMVVKINNVRVISCKSANGSNFYRFKLKKNQEYKIAEIEEHILATISKNVESWFKNKINRETIDEYFQSSIVFHKKHRNVLKIKDENPSFHEQENLINKIANISIKFSHVKFLKNSFSISYDIDEIDVQNDTNIEYEFDDDDNDDNQSIANDDVGPDFEEIQNLKCFYNKNIETEITKLTQKLDILQSLQLELQSDVVSLTTFDAVENAIA